MTTLNTALAAGRGEGPDFIGYINGPQDAPETVPATAPPLFDAIAFDDPLFPTKSFPIAEAWHAAGLPVELHAYAEGSHGFGLDVPGTTTTGVSASGKRRAGSSVGARSVCWRTAALSTLLDQFVAWLEAQGFLASPDGL